MMTALISFRLKMGGWLIDTVPPKIYRMMVAVNVQNFKDEAVAAGVILMTGLRVCE